MRPLKMRTYLYQAALRRIRLPRDLVRRAFKRYQKRTAVIFGDNQLTYSELEDRTLRICEAWRSLGIKSGDRVFTMLPDGFEQVETRLAAFEMGVILASFHERTPAPDLMESARLVRPSLLIYDPGMAGLVPERLALELCSLQRIPTGKTGRYETLLSTSRPNRSQGAIVPTDAAELVFSSGAGGHRKGILVSHAATVAALHNSDLELLAPDSVPEVYLSSRSLSGNGGRFLLGAILTGSELVLPHCQEPDKIQATVKRRNVSRFVTTPGHLIDLLDYPHLDTGEFGTVTRIICGTAPMPAAKLAEAIGRFGPVFEQTYTVSELAGPAAVLKAQEHVMGRDPVPHSILNSCGRPSTGIAACILTGNGRSVNPGEVGEILITSGNSMFRGYWPHPSLTGTAVQDGWLRTGDIGHLDSQGRIHILGRREEVILRDGHEIYPRFLEETLHSHPAVKEACLVEAGPDSDAVLCASIRQGWFRANPAALEMTLREFLAERVQEWQMPDQIRIFNSFPRSENGSPLRGELRQILEASVSSSRRLCG
jgi:fatty-acyl-CoA synthase